MLKPLREAPESSPATRHQGFAGLQTDKSSLLLFFKKEDLPARLAFALTLLLPLFLMHSRSIAEIVVAAIDLMFLLHCLRLRDWRWTGLFWMRLAGAWWAWQVLCSLPGIGIGGWGSLVQALAVARYLLLTVALQHMVLATPRARLWMQRVLTACTLYIAGQSLLQAAIGRNIQGFPRSDDGALTGPFLHARAGEPLSRLLYPVLLPPLSRWLGRDFPWKLLALATAIVGIGTMVLIGQRMPLLLTFLGLVVTALLLPRLRLVLGAALLAGAVLLGASAVVSPPTFYRLVTKFSDQMGHFVDSDYGQIGERALRIAAAHPILGQGFDAYRNGCGDPAYFRPILGHAPDGGGAKACNIHPHSHYLEAIDNAGIPGLVLFVALALVWLRELGAGLGRNPDPLRVGLFVTVLIEQWPLASTSGYTAMEAAGWFFVMLGYGLALAADSTAPISPPLPTPTT